jgi:serine protease
MMLPLFVGSLSLLLFGSVSTATALTARPRPTIDEKEFARGNQRGPGYVEGELLVKFRQDVAPEDRSRAARSEGDQVDRTITTDGLVKVKLGAGRSVLSAMDRWSLRGDVEYAAPNLTARSFFVPNDSLIDKYDITWNLRAVHAFEAWDVVRNADPNVVLAIIDSGVAYEDRLIPEAELAFVSPRAVSYRRSPELIGPFLPGYDFVNDDAYPDDDYGHGTNVATIAAGAGNNRAGSAGVAWGVSIMPVKVLDYRGDSNMEWIVAGIRFAADHGAHIANLSLGFPPLGYFRAIGYPPNVINQMFRPLRDAVDYAQAHGTILVAASGNFAAPEVSLPAGYSSVIAVGASNVDNRRSSYSSYGSRLDLLAPGGDFTDVNGDHIQDQIALMSIKPYRSDGSLANPDSLDTFFFIGTSAASPHVAGAVALLMSKGITRSAEIEQILRSTTMNPLSGGSDEYGSGVLDLSAAVRYGRGKNATGATDGGGDSGGATGDPLFPELFSGNPSVGDASIGFQVRQGGEVRVRIFDARGRLVRTLFEGHSTMGARRARWDGTVSNGSKAPSGVYFFRIETPQGNATRKFAFLR